MCFRPPDSTSGPLICEECGKKIVSPNFRPVKCPFCGAAIPPDPEMAPVMVPKSAGAGAPASTPAAPTAPKAPMAPKAPGAPL